MLPKRSGCFFCQVFYDKFHHRAATDTFVADEALHMTRIEFSGIPSCKVRLRYSNGAERLSFSRDERRQRLFGRLDKYKIICYNHCNYSEILR